MLVSTCFRRLSTLQPSHVRPLTVLGIETSCDDTACAIVNSDRVILSNAIRRQHEHHEPYGGVVPMIASMCHSTNLPIVVAEALDKAGLKVSNLDAIAVTRGPGILPCLGVGMNTAKTLAAEYAKPIIGVHHMEAHALTARLTTPNPTSLTTPNPSFPFLTLLISGGHTLLLLAHSVNNYTQFGSTLDDAVGEAIDKVSRMLGLRWARSDGGGPGVALEQAAARGDHQRFIELLTEPMNHPGRVRDIAFSFSGVKEAMRRLIEVDKVVDLGDERGVCDLAATFQEVCVRHLASKTRLALRKCAQDGAEVTSLVVSGGVASNATVRKRLLELSKSHSIPMICPPPSLCTDNGVMIAWAGLERFREGLLDEYTMDSKPKWPIESLKQSRLHV